ncbi:MAG: hypothetical protein WBB25_20095 [Sulfitobacter sp.]
MSTGAAIVIAVIGLLVLVGGIIYRPRRPRKDSRNRKPGSDDIHRSKGGDGDGTA